MTNRISQLPSTESRFSLPERIDYECSDGYKLNKVGEKLTLSVDVLNPEDNKTHTYVFRFNNSEREDLYSEMVRIAKKKNSPFTTNHITSCAQEINRNLSHESYDPRDNI